MVNGVALWDRTVIADGVDVVIRSTYATLSIQQAGCNKLQGWWNDEFLRLSSDQQATLIGPLTDLNNGGFKRSLVKVSSDSWAV